jgi:hypothetical protein
MDQQKWLGGSRLGSDPGKYLKSFPQPISLFPVGAVTPDYPKKNGRQCREWQQLEKKKEGWIAGIDQKKQNDLTTTTNPNRSIEMKGGDANQSD